MRRIVVLHVEMHMPVDVQYQMQVYMVLRCMRYDTQSCMSTQSLACVSALILLMHRFGVPLFCMT